MVLERGAGLLSQLYKMVCSENNARRTTPNPHNTDFFSGGSSSGCAVSVAASFVLFLSEEMVEGQVEFQLLCAVCMLSRVDVHSIVQM